MEFCQSEQYVNKVWLYKGIKDLCLNLTITYKTNPFPDNDKNNGKLFYDSVPKKIDYWICFFCLRICLHFYKHSVLYVDYVIIIME